MEMLPRIRWQTRVSDSLVLMAHLIKARSRVGMNDASIVLEAIVGRILNELYDWNLENLNADGPNFPAVDLGDREKREAVQVTVQDSGAKISHTVERAIVHKISNDYDRLTIFFLLPKKPAFPKALILPTDIKIETLDIADLTKRVGQISDISKLERITKIVEDEVGRNLNVYQSYGDEPRPTLHARFQEDGQKLSSFIDDEGYTSYNMSLWVENVPSTTQKVVYDILHESFTDSPWTIDRADGVVLEFETDDMTSYGDVDIWARGIEKGASDWRLRTTLYEALINEYSAQPKDKRVAQAMRDIRDN